MKISTDGLIIREQNIGEQDKLVTLLTSSHGVIKAFARNAKNIKSSKCASTSLLCYSRLEIFEGRDSYIIDDAKSIEMFINLRKNIENMSLAQYFCELCIYLCPQNMPSKDFLSLVLNSLYLLSNQAKDPLVIKACFEMRLMCLSGYMPNLVMCSKCGCYEHEQMAFLPKSGVLTCMDCLQNKIDSDVIITGIGVTTALRHIIYSKPKMIYSFKLPNDSLIKLNQATESYISHMIDRDFATLQFYKMIKMV